jgi:hypothetical protein
MSALLWKQRFWPHYKSSAANFNPIHIPATNLCKNHSNNIISFVTRCSKIPSSRRFYNKTFFLYLFLIYICLEKDFKQKFVIMQVSQSPYNRASPHHSFSHMCYEVFGSNVEIHTSYSTLITTDEMNGECSIRGRQENCLQYFRRKPWREKENLGDLAVNGRIILQRILKRQWGHGIESSCSG